MFLHVATAGDYEVKFNFNNYDYDDNSKCLLLLDDKNYTISQNKISVLKEFSLKDNFELSCDNKFRSLSTSILKDDVSVDSFYTRNKNNVKYSLITKDYSLRIYSDDKVKCVINEDGYKYEIKVLDKYKIKNEIIKDFSFSCENEVDFEFSNKDYFEEIKNIKSFSYNINDKSKKYQLNLFYVGNNQLENNNCQYLIDDDRYYSSKFNYENSKLKDRFIKVNLEADFKFKCDKKTNFDIFIVDRQTDKIIIDNVNFINISEKHFLISQYLELDFKDDKKQIKSIKNVSKPEKYVEDIVTPSKNKTNENINSGGQKRISGFVNETAAKEKYIQERIIEKEKGFWYYVGEILLSIWFWIVIILTFFWWIFS